jgi:LmbE family N-acetylglucosaminyl deacetylase
MNILAIGAHPDDIEFGVGATVAKLAKKGHNIFFFIMTFGGNHVNHELRKKEAIESAKILGVNNVLFGNVDPFQLTYDRKNVKIIDDVIEKIKPDEIYLPYPSDSHQDHRNVTLCSISATRKHSKIYFYETPSTLQDFIPQKYVNVGDHIFDKINALQVHATQHNKRFLNCVEAMEGLAIMRGMQSRNDIKYAEAFHVFRDVERE